MNDITQGNEKRGEDKAFEEMKRGVKYVTMIKGRKRNEVVLQAGTVKQVSPGAAHMTGWGVERVLDWADRCKVSVFVSGERGVLGKQVKTRLLPAQAA